MAASSEEHTSVSAPTPMAVSSSAIGVGSCPTEAVNVDAVTLLKRRLASDPSVLSSLRLVLAGANNSLGKLSGDSCDSSSGLAPDAINELVKQLKKTGAVATAIADVAKVTPVVPRRHAAAQKTKKKNKKKAQPAPAPNFDTSEQPAKPPTTFDIAPSSTERVDEDDEAATSGGKNVGNEAPYDAENSSAIVHVRIPRVKAALEFLDDAPGGEYAGGAVQIVGLFRGERFASSLCDPSLDFDVEDAAVTVALPPVATRQQPAQKQRNRTSRSSLLEYESRIHLALVQRRPLAAYAPATDGERERVLERVVGIAAVDWRSVLEAPSARLGINVELRSPESGAHATPSAAIAEVWLEAFHAPASLKERNVLPPLHLLSGPPLAIGEHRRDVLKANATRADAARKFHRACEAWAKELGVGAALEGKQQDVDEERHVVLYARDVMGAHRPASTFVEGVDAHRCFGSAMEAARFVEALYAIGEHAEEPNPRGEAPAARMLFAASGKAWRAAPLCLLLRRCTTPFDAANLLAALLVSMGFDAWVVTGRQKTGERAFSPAPPMVLLRDPISLGGSSLFDARKASRYSLAELAGGMAPQDSGPFSDPSTCPLTFADGAYTAGRLACRAVSDEADAAVVWRFLATPYWHTLDVPSSSSLDGDSPFAPSSNEPLAVAFRDPPAVETSRAYFPPPRAPPLRDAFSSLISRGGAGAGLGAGRYEAYAEYSLENRLLEMLDTVRAANSLPAARWDVAVSKSLDMALGSYASATRRAPDDSLLCLRASADADFLLAVRSRIAPGRSFRALPVRAALSRADSADDLLAALQSRSDFLDVILAHDDEKKAVSKKSAKSAPKNVDSPVRHGLRIRVEAMPEGIFVAWCVLGVET